MKTLNIDKIIRIKFSTWGATIYNNYYHHPVAYIDSQGYIQMQLWEFMSIYGPYMHPMCQNVLDDLDIYINDEDLHNVLNLE